MNANLNKESVPTLGEIEAIYEDILRYEASTKGLESKELGEFFKKFRKFEPHEKSAIVENKLIKKYRDYLKIEQDKQKKLIDNLENLISYEKFFLELERKTIKNIIILTSMEVTRLQGIEWIRLIPILKN